jgi:1-deoxy-D-xylulose-5-phosphate synthase
LPVVFCLDRAGITGDDGPSHHGVYDMALLSKVPGMRVLAPSSAQELQQMLHDAMQLADTGPVVVRYPKGTARNVAENDVGSGLDAREVRALTTETAKHPSVCILAIGKMVGNALKAAEAVAAEGIDVSVWDVRSCQPLDPNMISAAATYDVVLTFEDGIREGGIGSAIVTAITDATSDTSSSPRVFTYGVPTQFIAQAKPDAILRQLGLDADGIACAIRLALRA